MRGNDWALMGTSGGFELIHGVVCEFLVRQIGLSFKRHALYIFYLCKNVTPFRYCFIYFCLLFTFFINIKNYFFVKRL